MREWVWVVILGLILAAITAGVVFDSRDVRRVRDRCEAAGGVYVSGSRLCLRREALVE